MNKDKDNLLFDRTKLKLKLLAERQHNLDLSVILPLENVSRIRKELQTIAAKCIIAKSNFASIIFLMGAHVIRSGVQRYIIDLMERGYLSCIAINGAGVIHDYEFSLIGKTTESVSNYIQNGQFGLWKETGRINDIVAIAAERNKGLGEAIGRVIEGENFPHKDISVLAAGYRLGIPVTVHVGIGYDIVHEHPNCNGAAYGATSYIDFLRFTKIMESLEGGVIMNFGSSVMAPEVFLKSLAMVRNVALQEEKKIENFTTLVCDAKKLPEEYHLEPTPDNPDYYFRPWKTMLVRTQYDKGSSFYIEGQHSDVIPELWTAIMCS